jgi:hypothetical protein
MVNEKQTETPVFPTLEEQQAYWKQKENEHEAHLDEQRKNGNPRKGKSWSPEQREKFKRTMRRINLRKQRAMAMNFPRALGNNPDPKPQPELQAPKFCPVCGTCIEHWRYQA